MVYGIKDPQGLRKLILDKRAAMRNGGANMNMGGMMPGMAPYGGYPQQGPPMYAQQGQPMYVQQGQPAYAPPPKQV